MHAMRDAVQQTGPEQIQHGQRHAAEMLARGFGLAPD